MFSSKNNTYDFNFEWLLTKKTIQKALHKNERLIKSKIFQAGKHENVRFFFTLYPNGKDENQAGSVWIYFNILNDNDDIKADLCFDISEFDTKKLECVFSGSGSDGIEILKHEELPDILDFYTLKCHGILTIEPFQKWYLEKKKMNARDKDFRIFADKKIIKIHKYVLQNISSVFDVMTEKQILETDRLKITDFSYDIVRNAINAYYGIKMTLNFDELITTLYFADKYDMKDLKAKIEYFLMIKCTFKNVTQLLNVAIQTKTERLKNICESKHSMLLLINGIGKPSLFNDKEIKYKLNLHKDGYIKPPKFKIPKNYWPSDHTISFVILPTLFCGIIFLIMILIFPKPQK